MSAVLGGSRTRLSAASILGGCHFTRVALIALSMLETQEVQASVSCGCLAFGATVCKQVRAQQVAEVAGAGCELA